MLFYSSIFITGWGENIKWRTFEDGLKEAEKRSVYLVIFSYKIIKIKNGSISNQYQISRWPLVSGEMLEILLSNIFA